MCVCMRLLQLRLAAKVTADTHLQQQQQLQACVTHPSDGRTQQQIESLLRCIRWSLDLGSRSDTFGIYKREFCEVRRREMDVGHIHPERLRTSLRLICSVPQVHETKSVTVTRKLLHLGTSDATFFFSDFKFVVMKMYSCMPFIIISFPRRRINNQHDLTTSGCSLEEAPTRSLSFRNVKKKL